MSKITITAHKDKRGILIPFNFKDFPFQPKRVFFVQGPQHAVRGGHAHYKTRQFLYCLEGVIQIKLITWPQEEKIIILHEGQGFLHEPMEWADIYFQKESTLISFCSTDYDESDYIRDFNEFREVAASLKP